MDTNMSNHPNSSTPHMVDGVTPDGLGDSPVSSTGGLSHPRQKQVAISRNTTSGYERPERARTSHACEPCRERKTKCDGERPSCRRCLHTGTGCHYGYGKGWKKRKTAEDLTVTQRKLALYEELLSDIFPLVPDTVRVMIDQARQQDFAPLPSLPGLQSTESTDSPTPQASNAFDSEMQGSPSMNRLPLPNPVSITQSAPPFATGQRSLPRPLSSDIPNSPMQAAPSLPRSSGSPTDDLGGNPAIRLPSITRHGYLLDEAARNQQRQNMLSLGTESSMDSEQRGTPVDSRDGSRG